MNVLQEGLEAVVDRVLHGGDPEPTLVLIPFPYQMP